MLLITSLAIACFSVAYALSRTYWLPLVLVFFHGLFWSGLLSASSAYMTEVIPESRRAEGIGYWGMSTMLATAVAPAAGLWMYRHGWAWLCAGIALLNLVMAANRLAPAPRHERRGPDEPRPPPRRLARRVARGGGDHGPLPVLLRVRGHHELRGGDVRPARDPAAQHLLHRLRPHRSRHARLLRAPRRPRRPPPLPAALPGARHRRPHRHRARPDAAAARPGRGCLRPRVRQPVPGLRRLRAEVRGPRAARRGLRRDPGRVRHGDRDGLDRDGLDGPARGPARRLRGRRAALRLLDPLLPLGGEALPRPAALSPPRPSSRGWSASARSCARARWSGPRPR